MSDSFSVLAKKIQNKTILVTPNARLAKFFKEKLSALQEKEVWPSPNIFPLQSWMEILWNKHCTMTASTSTKLLSDVQDSYIWQNIVKKHSSSLFSPSEFSKKVQQAWQYCIAWKVEIFSDQFEANNEIKFFKKLVKEYMNERGHRITKIELIPNIIALIKQSKLTINKEIIFLSFDDLTPVQKELINALNDYTQSTITFYDEPAQSSGAQLFHAQTPQQELDTVINWIAKYKTTHKIGVVIPDIQSRRQQIELKLLEHFRPNEFNISMGRPLLEYPLIQSAITLLSLNEEIMPLNTLHFLCYSSHIGGFSKEKHLRHNLYLKTASSTEKVLFVSSIINKIDPSSRFHKSLLNYFHLLGKQKKLILAEWQNIFILGLDLFGFPGDNTLNSQEYQLHIKLMQALKELTTIDIKKSKYTRIEAIQIFSWHLSKIIYQPKAAEVNIHIMGFLESLGLHFDKLWVMGMDEKQIPQATSPSPFIPLDIQKQKQMPHACEEREFNLAKKHITRLIQSSSQTIFSYVKESDGAILSPSCFLETLQAYQPVNIKNEEPLFLQTYKQEYIFPPVSKNLNTGGTSLLREQANCPFRAFAKFRLKINEPRETVDGLDNLDKGILIHNIFEQLWGEIKTHEKLITLYKSDQLNKIIEAVVNSALTNLEKRKPYTFNKLYKVLELSRIKKIINNYLKLEMARPPFEVIATEQESSFKIGKLSINIRLDRIDRLENGDWITIDYKTGSPSLSAWFDERGSEPQLPIYALAEKKIKALMYAQLKQREIKNKGISQDQIDVEGVYPIEKKYKLTWSEQLDKWQLILENLSKEIEVGQIMPIENNKLCNTCPFDILCGLKR